MITKINACNKHAIPALQSHLLKSKKISCVNINNSYKTSQRINSIKSVCEDIFAIIKFDKNILEKTNAIIDRAKISENSITFSNENNSTIRFSYNVIKNNKLFFIELLEKNSPKASIILDSFGKLIKPKNLENLDYYSQEEINLSSLNEIIENNIRNMAILIFCVFLFSKNFFI